MVITGRHRLEVSKTMRTRIHTQNVLRLFFLSSYCLITIFLPALNVKSCSSVMFADVVTVTVFDTQNLKELWRLLKL